MLLYEILLMMGIFVGWVIYAKLLPNKKKQIPYALFIYIAVFPYRGIIVEYASIIDFFIDWFLFGSFFVYALMHKIGCVKYLSIFIVGYLGATISYALSIDDIRFIIETPDTRFMTGILLLVTYIWNAVKSIEQYSSLLRIFSFNAAVLSITDILYKSVLRTVGIGDWLLGKNFLAIYIFIGFVCLLYDRKAIKNMVKGRIVWELIILVELISLKSAAVYACLTFAVLVTCISTKEGLSKKRWFQFFSIILAVGGVFMMSVVLMGRAETNIFITTFMDVRQFQDYTRVVIWNEAWNIFKENFVFGIGPNNFRDSITTYSFPTHNDYMKLLSETGLIGTTAFGIFTIGLFRTIYNIKENKHCLYVYILCISMYIFILMHGYINYMPFYIVTVFPFLYQKNRNLKVN